MFSVSRGDRVARAYGSSRPRVPARAACQLRPLSESSWADSSKPLPHRVDDLHQIEDNVLTSSSKRRVKSPLVVGSGMRCAPNPSRKASSLRRSSISSSGNFLEQRIVGQIQHMIALMIGPTTTHEIAFGHRKRKACPPAAGARGELRINATRWQINENQNTKKPAELQL